MINCKYPQVEVHARRNKLNVNSTSPHMMQKGIYNVNEMCKKVERRPRNNIKRCFEC